MQRIHRANRGFRVLSSIGVACCAGLLVAASCREKPQGVEPPSTGEAEREMLANRPSDTPPFEPQVAGGFYPADRQGLEEEIRGYLAEAQKAGQKVEGDLWGIIVPHAGYPYSGPVAAFAFQALQGRSFRRVVVLGPAHRRAYPVPALLEASAYRTPLGSIPIDREGVLKLAATGATQVDASKFQGEHALEVELPFLQVVLKGFELVPLMIGEPSPPAMRKLAQALKEAFPGRDTLFLASTDMSHDYPYQVATAMDENALRFIARIDPEGLFRAYQEYRRSGMSIRVGQDGRPEPDCTQLCGMGPVLVLLELAKLHGDAQATVLDRRNSGDIVGDRESRIVGYSAVALTRAPSGTPAGGEQEPSGSTGSFLGPDEKQTLLGIARKTLEAYLKDGKKPDFDPTFSKLKDPGAAFVTLKKHGELRGCIGYLEPADPLWKMIRDRAVDAAVNDSRFQPVTHQELSDITIEISVLSPRVLVKDPLNQVVIGRDGVWLELGMYRGVFLPQVPVEQNWKTVEEYLDQLCRKAHLYQRGCWKSPEAKIMRFTALVFSEKD